MDMNGLLHEPELAWAFWSKEKSLPPPGIKL
jgi:hypothetical protein